MRNFGNPSSARTSGTHSDTCALTERQLAHNSYVPSGHVSFENETVSELARFLHRDQQ